MKADTIYSVCEELDALFLFIQLSESGSKSIRTALSACRDLRIPYVLYKDTFTSLDLKKVILPIGFLEEEMEKAQFAAAFGRFCSSEIKMLLANDYGSKAAANADKMKSLFDKFNFGYTLEKATRDSFKVEVEAIQVAENEQAGIIIVSASRDYGLDDILFGPKEYHVVKKSPVPVLLVNPRGDLYSLCD
jgi:nucleotide-binding universal stress UspA family protein